MGTPNIYVSASILNDTVSGAIQNPPGMMPKWRGGGGGKIRGIFESFTIAATDTAGSIYRIFKNCNPNWIPLYIGFGCTAITGFTSGKFGLYFANYGLVVNSGNEFMNAQTFASATVLAPGFTGLNGLGNLTGTGNLQKRLFDYAGETETAPTIATTRVDAFDLCLTTVTQSGAAGTIDCLLLYAEG